MNSLIKIFRSALHDKHLCVSISCPKTHEKFKFTILDRYRHTLQTYHVENQDHIYTFRFPCNTQASDFIQRVRGK